MEGTITISVSELKQLIFHEVQQVLASLNLVSPDEKDSVLDLEEACRYLNLKPATIYDLKYHNKIPTLKRGRKLCFSKIALDEWNAAGRPGNGDRLEDVIDQQLSVARKSRKGR